MNITDARDDEQLQPTYKGSAAFCADLVRTHDFERYASTLFVAPDARRSLLALYAFNVEIVRIRDLVSQALPGEIRMKWWIDALEGGGLGEVEANPVAAELVRVVDQYQIPVSKLVSLIEEHQFDLYNDPMPDYAVLDSYLGKTDGALFELASRTLGHSSDEIDHLAHHAGVACGFARILLSLPQDTNRRQLFLPQTWLGDHQSSTAEIYAAKPTPAIAATIQHAVIESRKHLDQAYEMLANAPSSIRAAYLPLAMAERKLGLAAQVGRDPFELTQVSRLRILWTLWRATRRAPFVQR